MSTQIGVGFSQDLSPTLAARDAALQARTFIQEHDADLIFVFSTSHYQHPEVLKTIRQTLNHPKTIGCSTAAIILNDKISPRGIGVLAIKSQEIKFGIGYVNGLTSVDTRSAGAQLAQATIMNLGAGRRNTFILFADGLQKETPSILKGAQEIFGKFFPILGAKSISNLEDKEACQFFQEQSLTSSATAVLLGGPFQARLRRGLRPGPTRDDS